MHLFPRLGLGRPARTRGIATATTVGSVGLLLAVPLAAQAADRGYELVSPPGGLSHSSQGVASQPDGRSVYWRAPTGEQTTDPAPDDGAWSDMFLAQRDADGWTSRWLTPDPDGRPGAEPSIAFPGMRADGVVFFSGSLWTTHGWTSTAPALYRGDGATTLLSDASDTAPSAGLSETQWVASEDLSSTVFATTASLDPRDTDGSEDLYLRRGSALTLLSARTDGTPENSAAAPFLPLAVSGTKAGTFADGALSAVDQSYTGFPVSQGAAPVSPDGRAVVFSTTAKLDLADTDTRSDLYLWRDGYGLRLISDDERSAPGCPGVTGSTDCTAATADVSFVGMSEDASTIYFRTREGLVDSDTDGGNDIYRYRVDAPAGQRLTRATGAGTSNAVWPVTVTPDGRLFFAATDRLGADPPSGTGPVLYRWDGTAIGTVAPLMEGDIFQGTGMKGFGIASSTPSERAVRATRDGSALLFLTTGALSADDTDAGADLYLWRAGRGVTLVSGAGPADVPMGTLGGPNPPGYPAIGGGRVITEDANRVFFTSVDALTDDAGDNGRQKLYEWDDGAGIALVSPSGEDAGAVTYVDNDVNGVSVFFLTGDALVAADTDGGAIDTYAATIGGGFPALGPPPDPCVGDECQGPHALHTDVPVAASVLFSGTGGVIPTPVPRPAKPTVSKSKAVRGTTASLRVTSPGPGRLRTSGSGLLRTSRTVTKLGHYTVKVKLTKRSRRTLQRKRQVTRTVRVAFIPTVGRPTTVSVRLTFRSTAEAKTTKKGR